mgnify:CR=1 FL=1
MKYSEKEIEEAVEEIKDHMVTGSVVLKAVRESGVLAEIALTLKQFRDEMVKVGFSEKQANEFLGKVDYSSLKQK